MRIHLQTDVYRHRANLIPFKWNRKCFDSTIPQGFFLDFFKIKDEIVFKLVQR